MLERTGLYAESWNVAWRKKKCGSIFKDSQTPFNIINNEFTFWAADPFLFEYNDDIFIFAELYDYVKRLGGIGYCKWTGNGFSKWEKVITEPYHLSYPFIFEKDGQIYIMPETGADHSLYLYQAVQFPNKWEKLDPLRSNVKYGDTTPFEWNGHRYALTYDIEDINNYKLILLDFEDGNDITLDLCYSYLRRPAGKVFSINNIYFRPAQNCANDYGEGLIFYQYRIDQNRYTEELYKKVMPKDLKFSKNILLDGIHTYNSTSNIEVIDVKTRRFNLLNFIFRVINYIKR